MAYKTRIAIAPDVEAALRALKKKYGVQSFNKVLRRHLGLTRPVDARQPVQDGAERPQ